MQKKKRSSKTLKWGLAHGKPDVERLGIFAEMPYMNGKGYVSPFARRKPDGLKGLICPGHKILVGTQDGLFESTFKRIFEGEVIVREPKEPEKPFISERPFISCCGSKLHASPGDYFGCFSGNIDEFSPKTRPVRRKEREKINFLTNRAKKGGPGYVGITIGPFPTYMWSRYGKKPKYKRYGVNLGGPMKTVIYSRPFFGPDPYADAPKFKPGRIYVKPKEIIYGKQLAKERFIPTGPGKWPGGTHAGCFQKFPEYVPETYQSTYEALKPQRERKVFRPQSMAIKSYYTTSIVNQNVDFRVNEDNHLAVDPTYLKYIAIRAP